MLMSDKTAVALDDLAPVPVLQCLATLADCFDRSLMLLDEMALVQSYSD